MSALRLTWKSCGAPNTNDLRLDKEECLTGLEWHDMLEFILAVVTPISADLALNPSKGRGRHGAGDPSHHAHRSADLVPNLSRGRSRHGAGDPSHHAHRSADLVPRSRSRHGAGDSSHALVGCASASSSLRDGAVRGHAILHLCPTASKDLLHLATTRSAQPCCRHQRSVSPHR